MKDNLMKDWRKPFKVLRDDLLQIYNTCPEMYHAIVLSVLRKKTELDLSLDYLEPKLLGHKPFLDISFQSDGCEFHCHRFLGTSNIPFQAFQRALNGIEEWCDHIPGGMVPALDIPKLSNQADRNLVRWMSLVYYLANVSKAPYLEIEVEYQQKSDEIGFFPWYECPHPPGWSPLDWLIRKGAAVNEIPKWKDRLEKTGNEIPDILDAYLIDGVVRSSIAAVDILISVLPMERRATRDDDPNRVKSKSSKTDIQKQGTRSSSRKRQKQIADLCRILRCYHDPDQIWTDPTGTVSNKVPYKPLNAKQWARILKWDHKGGAPADSTVRRVMEDIFGQDPMNTYQGFLSEKGKNRRLFQFIEQMLEQKGGQYYEQISIDEIKEYARQDPERPLIINSRISAKDEDEEEDEEKSDYE